MLNTIMAVVVFGIAVGYIIWRNSFADKNVFKRENVDEVEQFEPTEYVRVADGRLYEVEDGKASLKSVSQ